MNPRTVRHIAAIIAIAFIAIVIGIAFDNILLSPIAFFVLGFMYASADAFVDYCKMRSPMLFANIGIKGHTSLIDSDWFDVPLQIPESIKTDESYSSQDAEKTANGKPVIYRVMCGGGSSVAYLPFHGYGPIFICPREYVKTQYHGGWLAIADWYYLTFDKLPEEFQNALMTQVVHFRPEHTEVYWADTSPINGELKGDVAINLSLRCSRLQEANTALRTENHDLVAALQSMSSLSHEIKNQGGGSTEQYKLVKVNDA